MSYARLDALDGLQWPCPTEDHPGTTFLRRRLWAEPTTSRPAAGARFPPGPRRSRRPSHRDGRLPMPLTTGRRLQAFQHGGAVGALRLAPDPATRRWKLGPEDTARLGLTDGARVRVGVAAAQSRRRPGSTLT
ncbi:MAG: hypothetical protein IPI49_30755 [Myxococcales bacterium]|nr:hypothetical protein [Myxococcales bacterium]